MTEKKQLTKKELEDLLKRVQADFDNFRKRTEQERSQLIQSANANLILKLLPVLDNFRRAAEHAPAESWVQGIKAIERQLEEVMTNYGLKPIEVKPGDHFDPGSHEAVSRQPKTDQNADTVIKVVETGYQLNGKVLRPARVVVT